jgi:hypothetical protein
VAKVTAATVRVPLPSSAHAQPAAFAALNDPWRCTIWVRTVGHHHCIAEDFRHTALVRQPSSQWYGRARPRVELVPPDLRVYSAGLRPLGLVGSNLERPLFYDLNSVDLADMKVGPGRLQQIREEFRPDLIILAVISS